MGDTAPSIARLRWRCRRGTRELDLLLQCFLEREYPNLEDREKHLFSNLLDETDPDIYAWVTGRSQPDNPEYRAVLEPLRKIMSLTSCYGSSGIASLVALRS